MANVELYHAPTSFYSKKIRMALMEKRVPYTGHMMDHNKTLDHVEPWFLRINQKGKVPVLKHDGKFISESDDIIDYLDEHFNGPKLTLSPSDGEDFEKFNQWKQLLSGLKFQILKYGPNPEAVPTKKAWVEERIQKLHHVSQEHPDLSDACQRKVAAFQEFLRLMQSPEDIKVALMTIQSVLDMAEDTLSDQGTDWIFGSGLTSVDITLGILLQRLESLQQSEVTWDNDKHPKMRQFYRRITNRDTFKRGCCP